MKRIWTDDAIDTAVRMKLAGATSIEIAHAVGSDSPATVDNQVRKARRAQRESKMRRPMKPPETTFQPGGPGWKLVAETTVRVRQVEFSRGAEIPVESVQARLKELLNAGVVAWKPPGFRATSQPRAVPVASPPPAPLLRSEVESIARKYENAGDVVQGWRDCVAEVAERAGNPAAARDRLLITDAGSSLYRRAARVAAEVEGRKMAAYGAPARRPIPSDL